MGYFAILLILLISMLVWYYRPVDQGTGVQSQIDLGTQALQEGTDLRDAAASHDAQVQKAMEE